jgi:hypothetical protein
VELVTAQDVTVTDTLESNRSVALAKPKVITLDQMKNELSKTYCDVHTCSRMAELIFKTEDNELWLCFCKNHDPRNWKPVYPTSKK